MSLVCSTRGTNEVRSLGMIGVATWRRNSETSWVCVKIVFKRRIAAFKTTGVSFFLYGTMRETEY